MTTKRGFVLAAAVAVIALVLLIAGFIANLVLTDLRVSLDERERTAAFWAAEAGAEWAKARTAAEPDWFSDLPHSPADDIEWLKDGAIGQLVALDGSRCKVIREDGKNTIYSVGSCGRDVVSIIKVQFTGPPFKAVRWKEL